MLERAPRAEPAELQEAVTAALAIVDANIAEFGLRYPGDTTIDQRYADRPATAELPAGSNYGWTTSFWPGMLWLAHELSGQERYRELATAHVASFVRRVEEEIDLHTHDLGFLYTLSCIPAWCATGDPVARGAALGAADHLMKRFLEPAGIIQAWGDLANNPEQRGRTIIDSLMNMPLLYWASEQTGAARYRDAALRHVAALEDSIIREDDTTFHTFHWDVETGEPLYGSTQQGYADHSCWSRGQAWGIYGFAINYRHTGDETFLAAAVRCAEYFLDHLPADHVASWDLVFGEGSDQPRDSSAAAIAANGLLELAELVADPDQAARYAASARAIVDSLAASYGGARAGSNALLLHGVYDWPKSIGVDEGTLWGDYYYLEALARLQLPDRVTFW